MISFTCLWLLRDVYEEFLNHPPGICGFVDPVSIHCGYCLKKTVEDRSRRDMRDDGKCYGMLAEAEGKGMIHGKVSSYNVIVSWFCPITIHTSDAVLQPSLASLVKDFAQPRRVH